jgi:GNAT superfamily N-acetyltransferase
MAAGDHLNDAQFHEHLDMHVDSSGATAWHQQHGFVGEMLWDSDTGEVKNVEVEPKYRRKGVATAMWNAAREQGHNLQHSPLRTGAGDRWAKAIGGPTPKKMKADEYTDWVESQKRKPSGA